MLDKSRTDVHIDLGRFSGELRKWRGPAATAQQPKLLKESNSSAVLIGPWEQPWILTTVQTVAAVEVLVNAWHAGKRKCTKVQILAGFAGARTLLERFRDDPCWAIYIRGADGNERPRLWELNIGQPGQPLKKPTPEALENRPDEVPEIAETIV